jgi:hypothetical protein
MGLPQTSQAVAVAAFRKVQKGQATIPGGTSGKSEASAITLVPPDASATAAEA